MKKITKKSFNELHNAKKLWLIQGMVKRTSTELVPMLAAINMNLLKPIKTTSIDTGSQTSTGTTTTIYNATIQGRVFYIVETCCDNSKNNYVSWNTIDYYCTVYIAK